MPPKNITILWRIYVGIKEQYRNFLQFYQTTYLINEFVFQRQFSVCGLLVILLIKVSHIWMMYTFYLYCPSIMCSEFFIMRFCTNARVRLLTSSILVHMPPNFIIFDASQKMHHIFCCFQMLSLRAIRRYLLRLRNVFMQRFNLRIENGISIFKSIGNIIHLERLFFLLCNILDFWILRRIILV